MTISLKQLRTKYYLGDLITFLGLLTGVAITGMEVIINPYSRENLPITNLGGIFYRSIFVILVISVVWIYRYGWLNTLGLLFIYYGLQEFVFTNIFFGAYGQNMFQYLNFSVSWDIRIAWMLIGALAPLALKWYRINFKSLITGLIFFVYFIILLYIWPFTYFNGEGNIPLQVIPQTEEFMYNLLFPIWFFFLVRMKQ